MRQVAEARLLLALCLPVLLATGCGSGTRAPVTGPADAGMVRPSAQETSPQTRARQSRIPASGEHTVSRGDTLYGIAWRYGLDYRDVARWNRIDSPYLIYPGDSIRLRPPTSSPLPAATTARREPTPPIAPSGEGQTRQQPSPPLPSASTQQSAPADTSEQTTAAAKPESDASGAISWQWPAEGELLRAKSPTGEKGIRLAGNHDQPVNAAGPGRVVYSGSGLIGYGKLIIIKHNETYLSAYAHNNQLLVKEGDSVKGGQKIATMGTGSDGRAALHFEIRRNGQPIDPLEHLPRQRG